MDVVDHVRSENQMKKAESRDNKIRKTKVRIVFIRFEEDFYCFYCRIMSKRLTHATVPSYSSETKRMSSDVMQKTKRKNAGVRRDVPKKETFKRFRGMIRI